MNITDTFLRLALVALFGTASGMSCIAVPGCSLNRDDLLGKPPSIEASKGIFGSSVKVDTAFSGEADLTPDGKLTHLAINSDPVVVENARAEALMRALPAFQMQADLYTHQIDAFWSAYDKTLMLVAARIPIPDNLAGVLSSVGGTLDVPIPTLPVAGPDVVVSLPDGE